MQRLMPGFEGLFCKLLVCNLYKRSLYKRSETYDKNSKKMAGDKENTKVQNALAFAARLKKPFTVISGDF